MEKTLSKKIAEYILDQSEPVALPILLRMGAKRNIDRKTMLEAIRKVHKMKAIKTVERMGTVYYSPMPIHEVVKAPRLSVEDYPVMDETNNCSHEIFENMDFSQLFMTPEELRVLEWETKRQRERDLMIELKGHIKDTL